MKLKTVLTAAAVFCLLSVSAFADDGESADVNSDDSEIVSNIESGTDSENTSDIENESNSIVIIENSCGGAITEGAIDAVIEEGSGDSTVNTGIGGISAIIGIVSLAGAAVVVSRKKS